MNNTTRSQAGAIIVGVLALALLAGRGSGAQPEPGAGVPSDPSAAESGRIDGRKLGVILNSDNDGFLIDSPGKDITAEWYRDRVLWMLIAQRPGVLAQDVGMPDPVIYRSKVATTFDKHMREVFYALESEHGPQGDLPSESIEHRIRTEGEGMRRLFELGTDVLAVSIEACRQRGVKCVASFRMNAEDFGVEQLNLSDFGRAHKEWAIPGSNCLDPAIPEVYQHRMAIFREVAENYDIDGIEFDFRRWYHMVSDPLNNHSVLTRMVRDTRTMLDEVARKKGRKNLLLGARVGPNLQEPPLAAKFKHESGAPVSPGELSCKDLGLDVQTWVKEGLVDYLCPSTFHGSAGRRNPGEDDYLKSSEFVQLAKGSKTGIYPTVWCYTGPGKPGRKTSYLGEWMVTEDDPASMREFLETSCQGALRLYEEGVDGVSTFNWRYQNLPWNEGSRHGVGAQKTSFFLYPYLGDPEALRAHLKGAYRPHQN